MLDLCVIITHLSHMTSTAKHLEDILPEVERFLKQSGMRPTSFSRAVSNDPHFVNRLRKGGRVFPWTANKVRLFIKNPPPTQRSAS